MLPLLPTFSTASDEFHPGKVPLLCVCPSDLTFFLSFLVVQTLLIDGYISQTFQSKAAEQYFLDLLKSASIPPYATLYNVKRKDYRFFVHSASVPPHIPALFPNPPDRRLLDRGIMDWGTVVPQTMWSPLSSIDIRRHIERAELQIPVFFEDKDGRVGISLGACIDGQCRVLLRDPTGRAPLGQRSTTHVRIVVSMAFCSLWSLSEFEFGHHSGPVTKSSSDKSHFVTSRERATPSPWLSSSIVLGDL
jgi:hypothetical protein